MQLNIIDAASKDAAFFSHHRSAAAAVAAQRPSFPSRFAKCARTSHVHYLLLFSEIMQKLAAMKLIDGLSVSIESNDRAVVRLLTRIPLGAAGGEGTDGGRRQGSRAEAGVH